MSAVELTVERLKEAGVPPEKSQDLCGEGPGTGSLQTGTSTRLFRMYIKDEDEQTSETGMPESDIRKKDGSSGVSKAIDRGGMVMKVTGGWERPYPDENAYSIISGWPCTSSRQAIYPDWRPQSLGETTPLAQYVIKPLRKSDLVRWELDEGEEFYRKARPGAQRLPGLCFDPWEGKRLQSLLDVVGGGGGVGKRTGKVPDQGTRMHMGCERIPCTTARHAGEELARYGEPYWHRMLHQLPGVDVCLTHQLKLCNSGGDDAADQLQVHTAVLRNRYSGNRQGKPTGAPLM